MRFAVLILIAIFTTACSTNPAVGNWTAMRQYDPLSQQLVPFAYEFPLEVLSDGTYKVLMPDGTYWTGKYELDEAVTPHRFIAIDKDGSRLRGIYRVEGKALSIRIAGPSPDAEYPASFTESNDDNRGLIEFERKK